MYVDVYVRVRVCMYLYYEYAQTAWGRWRSIRVLTGRVMSRGWIINLRPRMAGKTALYGTARESLIGRRLRPREPGFKTMIGGVPLIPKIDRDCPKFIR